MLWVKAFHIIFMVTWFSGLFYLPRLFVYHVMATDNVGQARFKVMEHKLYYYITTPSAILTLLLGAILIMLTPGFLKMGWMHLKLSLVILLLAYHVYLGVLMNKFAHNRNVHSDRFYRVLNEIPVLFLLSIVILVVVKPF